MRSGRIGARIGSSQGSLRFSEAEDHSEWLNVSKFISERASSQTSKKTRSSSALGSSSKSPKWIKLDDIQERYVRSPVGKDGGPWILTRQANLIFAVAIFLQAVLLGVDTELELQAQRRAEQAAPDAGGAQPGSYRAGGALREDAGPAFYSILVVDVILNVVFCGEFLLRARALGRRYLCGFQCVFDMILNAGGIVYITLLLVDVRMTKEILWIVRAVRLLRIVRIARLVHIFPALALLVKGLLSTFFTIMYAMILLGIFSYIGAMFCAELLGTSGSPELEELFGSVPRSFLTHVKLVLVEGWPDIGDLMLKNSRFWGIYLALVISIGNFSLLNLVTGVVCDQVMYLAKQMPPASAAQKERELQMTKDNIEELFKKAKKEDPDHLSEVEYVRLLESRKGRALLNEMKIGLPSDLSELQVLLDDGNKGCLTCKDLQDGLMRLRGSKSDTVSCGMQCAVRKRFQVTSECLEQADEDVKQAMKDTVKTCDLNLVKVIDGAESRLMAHVEAQRQRSRQAALQQEEQQRQELVRAMNELKASLVGLRQLSSEVASLSTPATLPVDNAPDKASAGTQTEELHAEEMQDAEGAMLAAPPQEFAGTIWQVNAPHLPAQAALEPARPAAALQSAPSSPESRMTTPVRRPHADVGALLGSGVSHAAASCGFQPFAESNDGIPTS